MQKKGKVYEAGGAEIARVKLVELNEVEDNGTGRLDRAAGEETGVACDHVVAQVLGNDHVENDERIEQGEIGRGREHDQAVT